VSRKLELTALQIAERFVGVEEVEGAMSNPQILAMLRLDAKWPAGDEVPWCSGFVNYVAWLLGLPRSKSLAARSWLKVGTPVSLSEAEPGFDVVVLRRGLSSPGPEVLEAPGHVGFFAGTRPGLVLILGGNQGDEVNTSAFSRERVLGMRRLL
jgi:uncharacterized protein (TIGR02594 family)